jgi:hypothetical protein
MRRLTIAGTPRLLTTLKQIQEMTTTNQEWECYDKKGHA